MSKDNVVNDEGIKVRIFDLDKGLTEYEHIKVVRIISKDYKKNISSINDNIRHR